MWWLGGKGGGGEWGRLSRRNQTHGTNIVDMMINVHCLHARRAQMSESACCHPPPPSPPPPTSLGGETGASEGIISSGEVLFFGATVGAGWWDGKADGWVSIPVDRFVCERVEPYLGAEPPPKALPPRPRATFSLRLVGKVNVPTLAEKDQSL